MSSRLNRRPAQTPTPDAGERNQHRLWQRLHRFHGGLRLRHNKKISCRHPVVDLPMPERLRMPLLQHLGAPDECLVRVGDRVLRGQRLARATGLGADLHAPTSGIVEDIGPGPVIHPSGQPGPGIVLRADGRHEAAHLRGLAAWQDADPADLRERIRAAGVVGLGGAVFPTAPKLESGARAGVDTLILNGAECEPYISCDEMLMRSEPERVVRGAQVLQYALEASQAVIAIEDQMGAVYEALARAADQATNEDPEAEVLVLRVPKIYPEGGERQLIQVLTGREVPAGGFPHDLGLMVQNVATAAAAGDAVIDGLPLVERIVTVTGNGVRDPRNFRALLGTPVGELIAAAGGYTPDVARLVIGGPMMGVALADDAAPVVKATNCVLALNREDIAGHGPELPCIRCGECMQVCPAQLMPQDLHFFVASEQWDPALEIGLQSCIECGCCDFVCPSHIPLTEWFRWGKGEIRQRERDRAFAELSKRRHEARESRLARAEQEKAERLARRKQQLKDQAERKRQVAAAIERGRAGKRPESGDPESEGGKTGGADLQASDAAKAGPEDADP